MKLLVFDDGKLGVLDGEHVLDVTAAAQLPAGSADILISVIERFATVGGALRAAATDPSTPRIPRRSVRVRAPLTRPRNIVAMAVNYMENGTRTAPASKTAFYKSSSSIIGSGDTMVLPDIPATIFEGEAELAVVIGKQATRVSAANAIEHVFGYMNLIDGSARGLGPAHNVFFEMKSRETFCPIGPYVVTADEIANPQKLAVKLWVNGEVKQDFNTDDMAHSIAQCIEWVTSIHTLYPGDILATGTNHRGLSAFQNGDQVELEIEQLGRLQIAVRDDLERTWARETRLERQNKGLEGQTPQLTGKHAPRS